MTHTYNQNDLEVIVFGTNCETPQEALDNLDINDPEWEQVFNLTGNQIKLILEDAIANNRQVHKRLLF